jgi:hypothetical protein
MFLRGVDVQQSQIVTDTYQIVSGYDVNNFTAPISSFVAVSSTVADAACTYACTAVANCYFSVLTANLTCIVYMLKRQNTIRQDHTPS